MCSFLDTTAQELPGACFHAAAGRSVLTSLFFGLWSFPVKDSFPATPKHPASNLYSEYICFDASQRASNPGQAAFFADFFARSVRGGTSITTVSHHNCKVEFHDALEITVAASRGEDRHRSIGEARYFVLVLGPSKGIAQYETAAGNH
jgi:hypothetical protein